MSKPFSPSPSLLSSSSSSPAATWSQHRKYAVILDAGSSGTRLQVYSWLDPRHEIQSILNLDGSKHKPRAKQKEKAKEGETRLKQLPKVEKGTWEGSGKEWSIKVEPGLSSFSTHPQDLPSYLTPLLDQAKSLIPKQEISRTPIYLLATAGMRMLPKEDRVKVLRETCDFVRNSSRFKLIEKLKANENGKGTEQDEQEQDESGCGESVKVITGQEEGLLGWISINYLMDGFQFQSPNSSTIPSSENENDNHSGNHKDKEKEKEKEKNRGKHQHTFGFLDMGGASTQIAFEPSKKSLKKIGMQVGSKLEPGKGLEIHQDQVKETWKDQGKSESKSIIHSTPTDPNPNPDSDSDSDSNSTSETSEELTSISLNLLDGSTTDHKVFVTTFLGFGTNVARERYSLSILKNHLLSNPVPLSSATGTSDRHSSIETSASRMKAGEMGKEMTGPIPDPCLPSDLILDFSPTSSQRAELSDSLSNSFIHSPSPSHSISNPSNPSPSLSLSPTATPPTLSLQSTFQFKGTGNFTQCLQLTEPLLDKHATCNHPPCLFHGVHTPEIDFEVDRFVGVSEYWFSANDVFNLGGVYSFPSFQTSATKFCSENWSKLNSDFLKGNFGPKVDLSRLEMQCFKAAWMTTVLHEGIGLPRLLDSNHSKSHNGNKNQGSVETAPHSHSHSHSNDFVHAEDALDKAEDKNLATFQSVNALRGLAVSWTLGKAVLEASKEVGETLKSLHSHTDSEGQNSDGKGKGKGKEIEIEIIDGEKGEGYGWNPIPESGGKDFNHGPSLPHLPSPSIDATGSSTESRFILIGILIGILVLFITKRRKSRRRGTTGGGTLPNHRNPPSNPSTIVFNFARLNPYNWFAAFSRASSTMNGRGDYVLANMEEGAESSNYENSSSGSEFDDRDSSSLIEGKEKKSKPTSFERIFRRITYTLGLRSVSSVRRQRRKNPTSRKSDLLPINLYNGHGNANANGMEPNRHGNFQSNSNTNSNPYPSRSNSPGYSKVFIPRIPSKPGSGSVSPVLGRRSTPPISFNRNHIFNPDLFPHDAAAAAAAGGGGGGRNSPISFNSFTFSGNGNGLNNPSASTSALSSRANSPSFGLSVNSNHLKDGFSTTNGMRRSGAISPSPSPSPCPSPQNEFRRINSGSAISSTNSRNVP